MKGLVGFAVVVTLFCVVPCALAQNTGVGVMQGAGSAAMGAAKQAGEKAAAGQIMQNMGMMSPSPSTSPAAGGSPAPAPSAAQMPGAVPSVPQIPAAVPSPPAY